MRYTFEQSKMIYESINVSDIYNTQDEMKMIKLLATICLSLTVSENYHRYAFDTTMMLAWHKIKVNIENIKNRYYVHPLKDDLLIYLDEELDKMNFIKCQSEKISEIYTLDEINNIF
jgi:hypothetical protein